MRAHLLMLQVFFLSLSISITTQAQEKVFINELMPSNINGIMDDRYDFPDSWVELYNSGEQSINLKGWYLSNDKDDLCLWQIPINCEVPAKGYKILYLDKEEKGLHANFRLDIKGEVLYLTKPDGQTVVDQSKKFDKLAPNNAYGRTEDGTDYWGWMLSPTPGISNNGTQTVNKEQIVPSVKFSQEGGLYDTAISVALKASIDEAPYNTSIYYTTDGTEPNLQSKRYTSPLSIDSTTIIRAKVIVDGYLNQPSNVSSYLFPNRELTLPVISLAISPDYLWDDMIGIYTKGQNGAYYYKLDDYFNWAQDWRRPVNMEYFVDGKEEINQLGEMRIMGGFSREKPQKSLAVYANKRFGEKRFDYNFFQEKEPLDDGYKSIILRNSGQDFNRSFMRDAVNQYFVAGKIDIDYQAYQPAIVFLNGEYWGIHNIRERSNDDFVASNYDTEDIDMLEDFKELKAGDTKNFDAFYKLVTSKNFTYAELASYLDIEESQNFFILETFIANHDWPHNNNVCWRKREGGKWRFITKDTDYSTDFGSTSYFNAFEYINNGTSVLNKIINGCWGNDQYKEQFIDRYTVYLGDIFQKDITIALVDSFANQIDEEMKIARPRWDLTYDYWQTNIKNMRNWLRVRPNYVYDHLQSFFQLQKPISVTIKTNQQGKSLGKELSINNITVHEAMFNGKFFGGRKMEIALNQPKTDFRYWQIKRIDKDGHADYQLITDQQLSFTADTMAIQYEIEAIMGSDIPLIHYENGELSVLTDINDDNLQKLQECIAPLLPSVTSINLTAINYKANIPLDELFASANPNRLIYTEETLEGTNVICGLHATSIVLSNQYPFNCPQSFEADHVLISNHLTSPNSASSYHGLVIPFTMEVDEIPSDWRVLTLSEDQFIKSETIKANCPYLIRYGKATDSVRITVEQKQIEMTPNLISSESNETILHGSYHEQIIPECYGIDYKTTEPSQIGRIFSKQQQHCIQPFSVYLTTLSAALPESFPIAAGIVATEQVNSVSGLRITTRKGGLLIDSETEQVLQVFTADGKWYQEIHVPYGQMSLSLPVGLYIINRELFCIF